jgi:Flp pilus assembly protein TadD
MSLRTTCCAALVLLLLGCTQASPRPQTSPATVEELLSGTALGQLQPAPVLIDDDEILAVSPEMARFLDSYVDRDAGSFIKLHHLLYAIISEGSFGLEYDDRTRTAAQTFAERRGNCLSFSNMFVAMARDVGLNVSYQEVEIPPDWSFDNDVYVLNRHVNVHVELGITGEHVVDFNIDDFRASYDRRVIPDRRAFAHYYNNLGAEHMLAGDRAAALAYFRKALFDSDRSFSPAWTNLGTLYRRSGLTSHAEAAYLQALTVDRHDEVAVSSLAELYRRRGETKLADAYLKKVINHRKQNPYYRYHLAREAFFSGDYPTAISHLRYAARKKPNEDLFCFLLGVAYLQNGDKAAARRWLTRAEEVAATDALKRNYSSKMEALLSTSQ